MKLKDYLKESGVRQSHLAKKMGVTSTTFWRWKNGAAKPNWASMKLMQELTQGKVKQEDWTDK
jgi:DNA-binding XRE family transcriptional regulator